ncbi:unnamed protein product [Gongylonema pulchrum]|uniref:Secreted protein n=1 Tax=Gongylonema pulchrum TaxID=637853 RepID=A0A183EDV9_9BILA|nr:unnamed protein product [Gongylonema pulchrum]
MLRRLFLPIPCSQHVNSFVTADVDFICGHCPSLSEEYDVACCVEDVILYLAAVLCKDLYIVKHKLESGMFCNLKWG